MNTELNWLDCLKDEEKELALKEIIQLSKEDKAKNDLQELREMIEKTKKRSSNYGAY